MSFGTFSFFYYFVFIWGSLGMLFIAAVVIKEMLTINKNIEKDTDPFVEKKEVL